MIVNEYRIDPALLGFGIPQRTYSYLTGKPKWLFIELSLVKYIIKFKFDVVQLVNKWFWTKICERFIIFHTLWKFKTLCSL